MVLNGSATAQIPPSPALCGGYEWRAFFLTPAHESHKPALGSDGPINLAAVAQHPSRESVRIIYATTGPTFKSKERNAPLGSSRLEQMAGPTLHFTPHTPFSACRPASSARMMTEDSLRREAPSRGRLRPWVLARYGANRGQTSLSVIGSHPLWFDPRVGRSAVRLIVLQTDLPLTSA